MIILRGVRFNRLTVWKKNILISLSALNMKSIKINARNVAPSSIKKTFFFSRETIWKTLTLPINSSKRTSRKLKYASSALARIFRIREKPYNLKLLSCGHRTILRRNKQNFSQLKVWSHRWRGWVLVTVSSVKKPIIDCFHMFLYKISKLIIIIIQMKRKEDKQEVLTLDFL